LLGARYPKLSTGSQSPSWTRPPGARKKKAMKALAICFGVVLMLGEPAVTLAATPTPPSECSTWEGVFLEVRYLDENGKPQTGYDRPEPGHYHSWALENGFRLQDGRVIPPHRILWYRDINPCVWWSRVHAHDMR
jgi:hypothetical protein